MVSQFKLYHPCYFNAAIAISHLAIRMTQEDREQINRAAETEAESASEWARQILLKAAKRRLK